MFFYQLNNIFGSELGRLKINEISKKREIKPSLLVKSDRTGKKMIIPRAVIRDKVIIISTSFKDISPRNNQLSINSAF